MEKARLLGADLSEAQNRLIYEIRLSNKSHKRADEKPTHTI